MGLFSDIGNFISNNISSAVNDVTHVVQQVAPIAIGALINPVGTVANILGPRPSTTQQSQVVDNSSAAAINQLNANQQALAAQNAALAQQLAAAPAGKNPTDTQNSLLENLKKYWYFIAIPVVALTTWLIFKPKNQYYVKR